jgi:hypothetical protein
LGLHCAGVVVVWRLAVRWRQSPGGSLRQHSCRRFLQGWHAGTNYFF